MAKFRKKPVVIEAVLWTGSNVDEICGFVMTKAELRRRDYIMPTGGIMPGGALIIETLEDIGEGHLASPGDWIIKGVSSEFYPCKPDIFEKTYEAVEA